ncbi:isoaspartyl peptidase/L-asparaginase family protein [Hellea balneolensis]|uniref:isoaspartyl peptidase/L-asparaginase family protein n=1 Tax=Hellea balneolensis TaxID=287478 RepID=UPI000412B029|nr:isoaspartyl peptidase/L-asparaginase [Hellea balneolensis]
MRRITLIVVILALYGTGMAAEAPSPSCPSGKDYTLAIHGGAGVILKENMTDKRESAYRKSLSKSLGLGGQMLEEGYSALDAVQFVVMALENDPKFNAGKGAVFSAAGKNELDAAIMDGRDRNAGAVSSVTTIKNPIVLARAVMENSRHVMFQGQGAEDFAKEHGIEQVDPKYFYTKRRYDQMKRKVKANKVKKHSFLDTAETKYGTVGAVAKDGCGNLAAATSTGGLTGKEFGRVGDTPIIGAGTYADNRYCAVSATGTGEFFIRAGVARDICSRREYLGESIAQSSNHVIHKTLTDMKGDGGVVAIDEQGNYSFAFNTPGMYRGANKGGKTLIEIFDAK